MSAFVGDMPEWIPEPLLRHPAGIQLWGESRIALNRAAWELARRINPAYLWLEIGDPHQEGALGDPGPSGLVPADQLFRTIPPSEFRPNDVVANLALWAVIRSDEPSEPIDAVVDFVRLPVRVQSDLRTVPRKGRPGVYVMANTDRLFAGYPDDPETNRRQIASFRRQNVALITTVHSPPKEDRMAYDYVFEVRTPPEVPWIESTVRCERGPRGETGLLSRPVSAFWPAQA